MTIYAIGDVQGCYTALSKLLDKLAPTTQDQLWFVGDLVNRGPQSLQVLRLLRSLGKQVITVLGNHDIHLLCVARGARPASNKDTLDALLLAPDRDQLLDWLSHKPLFYFDPAINTGLVHAGVLPHWDLHHCLQYSASVSQILASNPTFEQLQELYGNHSNTTSNLSPLAQHLRMLVNVFTRIRYCKANGSLDLLHKGPLGSQTPGLLPWFDLPNRKTADIRLVFGHWSALGLYQRPSLLGLDSGCIWGGKLTAARLDTTRVTMVNVPCQDESFSAIN
ncbi:MAG TPA: symmetrical bis(5'-nucleosyl)-tetraphosphatase [Gammaproteobacteria bacterium]|nr:symmetrical bis(5'-nucleosyl)-tetraphosphatase [Gammaproteobacteria bacterium]